jgi:hypothetical protein
MNLSSEDVQRYVRIAIYWAAGFTAAHGVTVDPSIWNAAVPVAMFLANFGWSAYGMRINAKLNELAKYAGDPSTPIQAIITTNTPAGVELAKSTPGPVVSAGSQAAVKAAAT